MIKHFDLLSFIMYYFTLLFLLAFTTPVLITTSLNVYITSAVSRLDHNDGQFFRAMEWLMFFLGHHCRQWFFNGFDKVGPSPLNVFLGV